MKVNPKECFKKHLMLHSLAGLGVGFMLVALVPSLIPNAMMIGIGAIVVAIAAEALTGQN